MLKLRTSRLEVNVPESHCQSFLEINFAVRRLRERNIGDFPCAFVRRRAESKCTHEPAILYNFNSGFCDFLWKIAARFALATGTMACFFVTHRSGPALGNNECIGEKVLHLRKIPAEPRPWLTGADKYVAISTCEREKSRWRKGNEKFMKNNDRLVCGDAAIAINQYENKNYSPCHGGKRTKPLVCALHNILASYFVQ